MRPLLLALLALALTGCLEAPTPPVTDVGAGADDCRAGTGAVFLASVSGGGFVPQDHVPRLVEVTHDGRLRALDAYSRAGEGRIVEERPGALGNLTPDTAFDMAARRNLSLAGRDLVVTRGLEAPLSTEEFERFCQRVAAQFHALKERYVEGADRCADQGSTTWDLSMRQGEKRVFVDDCATDAGAVRPLFDELRALVDAHSEA